MIKAIHCDMQDHSFHCHTNLDRLEQIRAEPNSLLWLDLYNPSQQDLEKIGKEFHLHPLALEDATREHQRPKIEAYDNFFFMVFYTAHLHEKTQDLEVAEIDVFLGKGYMITVHHRKIEELEEIEQRWTRNKEQLEEGIGTLLYSFLDTIVDSYFPLVDILALSSMSTLSSTSAMFTIILRASLKQ
jgi:magnesium transporter